VTLYVRAGVTGASGRDGSTKGDRTKPGRAAACNSSDEFEAGAEITGQKVRAISYQRIGKGLGERNRGEAMRNVNRALRNLIIVSYRNVPIFDFFVFDGKNEFPHDPEAREQ
jgi:hypothetical protein